MCSDNKLLSFTKVNNLNYIQTYVHIKYLVLIMFINASVSVH